MIDVASISPNLPYATLLAVVLLIVAQLAGWTVVRLSGSFQKSASLLIVTLPLGALILVGLSSTIFLGRLCHLSVLVFAPLALALIARWCGAKQDSKLIESAQWSRKDIGSLGFTFILSVVFSTWLYVWYWPDGRLTLPYNDLGYFSIVVKGLPESGLMSIWSGTLGGQAKAAGATDVWYHWGPLWLGCAVSRLGGVTPLVALIHVVVPALTFLVVVGAGAVVSALTKCSLGRGLCFGALSLVALPLPVVSASSSLMGWISGGLTQHLHLSLAYRYCFTYRLEAFFVHAVLACWLLGLRWVAVLLLFLAGISAPHSVAGLGVVAGVFGVGALLRRCRRDVVMAAVAVGSLLSAWAVVSLGFGVDLPKSGDAKIVVLDPDFLQAAGIAFCQSLGVGILIALPSIAGVLHLIRSRGDGVDDHRATVGWFALSALVGSYAAYHFLLPDGEKAHFVGYAHAIVLFPVGTCGLLLAAQRSAPLTRWIATVLLCVTGAFGVYDSWVDWRMVTGQRQKYAAADLQKIKVVIGNEEFGYFAPTDRPWWIPNDSSLAAILGTSCTRLNLIPETDETSTHARFYGAKMPRVLVPKLDGESEDSWSLRFARRLGIRFLIETDQHPIPAAVKPIVTPVTELPGLRVFRLNP